MATITRQSISASTSISSFVNMLKIDYLPRIDDWIQNDAGPLPTIMLKKAGDMGGQKSMTAAFTAAPQGVGFTAEGYNLPDPTTSSAVNPEVLGKEFALRHRLTFESQQTARKSSAAFAKPKAEEMRMLRDEMKLRLTRNLYHGPYDIAGRIGAAGGGATVTLSPRNARRYTASLFYASGNHYIRPNHQLQMIDSSIGGDASSAALGNHGEPAASRASEIASVSSKSNATPSAPTITLSGDPGGATVTTFSADTAVGAGDLLVAFASRNDAAGGVLNTTGAPDDATTAISEYHGMNGLANIATDTTLYTALFGLLKSAADGLLGKAHHASGVARAFTDRLLEFFLVDIQTSSGLTPAKFLLEPFTQLEVTKEYRNLRQFSPIIGKAGVSGQALVTNEGTWGYTSDLNCLPGLCWGVSPESMKYYEWFALQSPDDGEMRFVANKAQVEMILMRGGNVFCESPWRNGIVDDIIFDTTALT